MSNSFHNFHHRREDAVIVAGRCARDHARASAAAEMRQPTPSTQRDRRLMGFANQVAGGCVG
eukprot:5107359-Pyramimonas_sp.AAC.1